MPGQSGERLTLLCHRETRFDGIVGNGFINTNNIILANFWRLWVENGETFWKATIGRQWTRQF